MGNPIPVEVNGETFYVCCEGCLPKAKAKPQFYLSKVKEEVKKLEQKQAPQQLPSSSLVTPTPDKVAHDDNLEKTRMLTEGRDIASKIASSETVKNQFFEKMNNMSSSELKIYVASLKEIQNKMKDKTPIAPGNEEPKIDSSKQKTCPVNGELLGSMGKPIGVKAKGQTIYVCCKGCVKEVEDNPEKYLETVKQQIKEN
jgi:YHS domain-containing protein